MYERQSCYLAFVLCERALKVTLPYSLDQQVDGGDQGLQAWKTRLAVLFRLSATKFRGLLTSLEEE